MREDIARRVMTELEANGYEPRLHEPEEEGGLFEISLPGHGFDLGDLKAMAKSVKTSGSG
jgi:hypothetical protein